MAGVFPASTSGKRELVIKRESSSPESRAIETGEYHDLFSISTLNHLQITGFPSLTSLSPDIGKLGNLLQLTLTHNSLATLPDEISGLSKLKHLDVSHNKITSIPASLCSLHALQTLIVSHNALTDESFPPTSGTDDASSGGGKGRAEPSDAFLALHRIDLLGNKLTNLPELVYATLPLLDLVASDNLITTLEPAVGCLVGLKSIDLKRNRLTALPYELSNCTKLRSMGFEDNPLLDRRLLKLVAQHGASKPKAVLDYIASHMPKTATSSDVAPKGKKGPTSTPRKSQASALDDNDEGVDFTTGSKMFIQIVRPAEHVVVTASAGARSVRPYLVCAVIRGVDLSDEVAYKEFITLQTKLHDTVCKRRRVATMATHNLDKISPPLRYSCQPAGDISLTPLGHSKTIKVQHFIRHLESCKVDKRGGGGRKKGHGGSEPVKEQDAAAIALSKYLQFVDPGAMVFLQDHTDTVISLPPLTNCEHSKIDSDTVNMFLEVSSSESLGACKSVMDALVCGMCDKGLGVVDRVMRVEQVRVVDEANQLLVLYPSRTDLLDTSFTILRPQ